MHIYTHTQEHKHTQIDENEIFARINQRDGMVEFFENPQRFDDFEAVCVCVCVCLCVHLCDYHQRVDLAETCTHAHIRTHILAQLEDMTKRVDDVVALARRVCAIDEVCVCVCMCVFVCVFVYVFTIFVFVYVCVWVGNCIITRLSSKGT